MENTSNVQTPLHLLSGTDSTDKYSISVFGTHVRKTQL